MLVLAVRRLGGKYLEDFAGFKGFFFFFKKSTMNKGMGILQVLVEGISHPVEGLKVNNTKQ